MTHDGKLLSPYALGSLGQFHSCLTVELLNHQVAIGVVGGVEVSDDSGGNTKHSHDWNTKTHSIFVLGNGEAFSRSTRFWQCRKSNYLHCYFKEDNNIVGTVMMSWNNGW